MFSASSWFLKLCVDTDNFTGPGVHLAASNTGGEPQKHAEGPTWNRSEDLAAGKNKISADSSSNTWIDILHLSGGVFWRSHPGPILQLAAKFFIDLDTRVGGGAWKVNMNFVNVIFVRGLWYLQLNVLWISLHLSFSPFLIPLVFPGKII